MNPAPDERRQALERALQQQVLAGDRIEWQSGDVAVTVRGHRLNHLLHLIISVTTLGAWALVWIGLAVSGGEKRRVITVDERGEVRVQDV